MASFGAPSFLPSWLTLTPLSLFRDGFAGVSIFFVLSGLVLTRKYFDQTKDYDLKTEIGPFYVARVTRICLPFVAALILSALVIPLAANLQTPSQATDWIKTFWTQPLSFVDILRQSFLPFPAKTTHLLPQDWTLTIELNVSALMPFFTLIASKSACWFVFFILLQLKNHWFFAHFALGILISKYFKEIQRHIKTHPKPVNFFLFSFGIALYTLRFTDGAYLPGDLISKIPDEAIWIVTGVGSAFIIMIAMSSDLMQRFLEHRILVYLGKISYSIYLFHFFVIKTFCIAMVSLLVSSGVTNTDNFHLMLIPLSTSCLIVVSGLSYKFIEVPSINLGRTLNRRFFK